MLLLLLPCLAACAMGQTTLFSLGDFVRATHYSPTETPTCVVPSCELDTNVNFFLPALCCEGLPAGGDFVTMPSGANLSFSVPGFLRAALTPACMRSAEEDAVFERTAAAYASLQSDKKVLINVYEGCTQKIPYCPGDSCQPASTMQVSFYVAKGCGQCIDTCNDAFFEDLAVDASIEGPGTVLPQLELTSLRGGELRVIESGRPAASGQAGFNAGAKDLPQNAHRCLENAEQRRTKPTEDGARGFTDVLANVPGAFHAPDFRISVIGNLPAERLSFRVFDFGDFEEGPSSGGFRLEARAFDAFGALVAQASKSVVEIPQCMVPPCEADACGASDSLEDPGYFEFTLEAPGIRTVDVVQTGVMTDPNVGYDSLRVCA